MLLNNRLRGPSMADKTTDAIAETHITPLCPGDLLENRVSRLGGGGIQRPREVFVVPVAGERTPLALGHLCSAGGRVNVILEASLIMEALVSVAAARLLST